MTHPTRGEARARTTAYLPHRPGSGGTHDAVVIGGGAGGLTAALTLAQQGASTLLSEKNPVVGGYAHGDGDQGSSWDHGGHVLLAYRLGSAARQVFERRGIDRRIEMVPDRQTFQCVFPDARTEIPADLTMAAERLSRQDLAERAGITRLLLDMERMVADLDTLVPSCRIRRRAREAPAARPGARAVPAPLARGPWRRGPVGCGCPDTPCSGTRTGRCSRYSTSTCATPTSRRRSACSASGSAPRPRSTPR